MKESWRERLMENPRAKTLPAVKLPHIAMGCANPTPNGGSGGIVPFRARCSSTAHGGSKTRTTSGRPPKGFCVSVFVCVGSVLGGTISIMSWGLFVQCPSCVPVV